MTTIVPFEVSHLLDITVQPEHAVLMPLLWGLGLTALRRSMVGPWSWTAMQEDVPVAACGIVESGHAWAFLSVDMRRNLIPVTRAVRRVLDTHRHAVGPVLAHIDEANKNAVRWAKFLGFKPDLTVGDWYFDARPL